MHSLILTRKNNKLAEDNERLAQAPYLGRIRLGWAYKFRNNQPNSNKGISTQAERQEK
jgi:hypothetical protein